MKIRAMFLACVLIIAVACEGRLVQVGSTTGPSTNDAGDQDGRVGAGPSATGDTENDAAVPVGPSSDQDGDTTGSPNASLLDQLGGLAALQALVKSAIEDADGIASDSQLLSYFAIRTSGGFSGNASGGDPSLQALEDCFAYFLANQAAGVWEQAMNPYPISVNAGGGATFICREMKAAHTGLGVTDLAFQHFVAILAMKFAMGGVTTPNLTALGQYILGTSTDIVDKTRSSMVDGDGGSLSGDKFDGGSAYGASCATIATDNATSLQAAQSATSDACDPTH